MTERFILANNGILSGRGNNWSVVLISKNLYEPGHGLARFGWFAFEFSEPRIDLVRIARVIKILEDSLV